MPTLLNSFIKFPVAVEELFASMYESFVDLDTLLKSHYVEWFTGKQLTSDWTFNDVAGTGSGAMFGTESGGYQIATGTSVDDESTITFNDKRHYAHDNCECYIVIKSEGGVSRAFGGFSSGNACYNSSLDYACASNNQADTNVELATSDGTTASETEGSVATSQNYHIYKLELISANVKMYIDGSLDVTKTTNRPDTNMQPIFGSHTNHPSSRESIIRYGEWRGV